MIAKVNEQGLLITPELLRGATEVDIREEPGRIVIVLEPNRRPVLQLGKNPVVTPETDAAINHDRYIYTR